MNFSPRRPVRRSTGALERLIDVVQQRPRMTLILAGLLAFLSLAYAGATLEFKTSRDDLVDSSEAYIKNWKKVQDEFGGEEDVIVAVASGAGEPRPERLAAAIETIARDIETFPQLFRNLRFRIDADKLRAKGLYQLSLADVRRIEQKIDPLRPLLIGTWNWLTLDNVLHSTRFRLDNLPVGQPMEEHQRETLQNAIRILDSLAAFLANERVYQSPWPTVLELPQQGNSLGSRYFFAPNGRTGFLRVEVVRDRASFVGAGKAIEALQQIVQQTNAAFPDLEIGLTGLPVLENDEMQAAQADSSYSTILSIVGVSLLFFAAFRSLWRPLYAILALLVGSAWTMGWVALTVGHLNILSVSFIVTLIGLGIDYGILWLTRFEGELDHGADFKAANLATVRDVGPGILVGAVTTALAFWMTMLTGFLGLREMGWIAGSGVILCLIAAFTVLPALLALQQRTSAPRRRRSPEDAVMAPFLAQRPMMVATGIIAATAVLSAWIPNVRFDYNLLNLQAAGMKSVEWEKRLIHDSGASAWYALSTAESREAAIQLRKRFEQLPSVGRVVEFASLIPDDQAEKRPLIRELHNLLQPLPAPDQMPQRAVPRVERLIEQCHDLAEAGQRFRDRPADECALIAQMSAAARRAEAAIQQIAPIACGKQIASYERRWVADLVSQLHQLRSAVANPDPVTIADLPPALLAGYHSAGDRWLVQVFAKSNVWDIDPLKEFARQVASVDPNISGKPISTLHALVAMTDGYWQSAWLAAIVIALAVWLDFRHLGHTLLALSPLVVGCVASMGTMGLCGISFNPANMIALPLVLGIGVDYGVHVLHDYRNSLAAGSIGYRMTWRLGRALMLTSSTTLLSFAALIVARHQGMHSIGLVLAIGVGWCTAAAMLLLPAVLQWMEQPAEQPATIPMPLSDNIYSKSA